VEYQHRPAGFGRIRESARMDRGAKTIAGILVFALALGLVVTFAHPAYRRTAAAMFSGAAESSPLWISNRHYYPLIGPAGTAGHAE
jgi:hypothetical protein